MTTPVSRPTVVRRPWIDYLKENRERWIREAGKRRKRISLIDHFLSLSYVFLEEEKRRKELKVIEEEP